MLRRMRDWLRMLDVLWYVDQRRLTPTDLRQWFERTVALSRRYIGGVRCHCPECGAQFQRDIGIRLIGRVLVGVYKSIRYGPPEGDDATH